MIEVREEWGVTILTLGARHTTLDASAARVRKVLERLAGSRDRLLLDCSRTKRIDAGFLGALVRAWKRIKRRNGELALCCTSASIQEMLETCRLTSLWPTYRSRADALEDLSAIVSAHVQVASVSV